MCMCRNKKYVLKIGIYNASCYLLWCRVTFILHRCDEDCTGHKWHPRYMFVSVYIVMLGTMLFDTRFTRQCVNYLLTKHITVSNLSVFASSCVYISACSNAIDRGISEHGKHPGFDGTTTRRFKVNTFATSLSYLRMTHQLNLPVWLVCELMLCVILCFIAVRMVILRQVMRKQSRRFTGDSEYVFTF